MNDDEFIPLFVPQIGPETLEAVKQALDHGWLGMGSITSTFEGELASWLELGERRILATNTGTSALHMAIVLAGVGPADEVIVPAFNFVADHQAISAEFARPVFCDIETDTLGIDVRNIDALMSPRTKAILPLHFAGVPCRIQAVYDVAAKYGLRVIEDATHAFGSSLGNQKIGSFGDLTCFSFDPVKIVTSIDGGALVVPDHLSLAECKRLRVLGIDADAHERRTSDHWWEYDVRSRGFRYHMSNVIASVGRSQLLRAEEYIERRRHYCRSYSSLLSGIPEILTPYSDFDGVAPFIYTVRVLDGSRDRLMGFLRDRGIGAGVHFLAAHHLSLYRDTARWDDLSVTERVASEIVTLPLHSYMEPGTVDRVAECIRRFFRS